MNHIDGESIPAQVNALLNPFPDFCLFAPPKPNTTIGDSEGEEVAWCTKKGLGSRLIPEGAL